MAAVERICEYEHFSDVEYTSEQLLFYPENNLFRIIGYNWIDINKNIPVRDEYAATVDKDFVEVWLKDKPMQKKKFENFLKRRFL
jgi:hypothetical protein